MTTRAKESITAQAAGALGEKAVETELLRRNWIPANVNATVKNAEDFDIYALKRTDKRAVYIRVKTCRPNQPAFLCGGFPPDKPITTDGISEIDFTIVVRMGNKRDEDRFYVVPTRVVREEINKRQADHRARRIKDIGMWRLSFSERRDKKEEAGRGIERRWSKYLDKWELLDG
jgi:predicted AAA+ superfamily ATPase